ncbi:MAG: 50S ribosomal protein L32 [Smithellaceae bacterium]|nr:50S ribosomal protein L32 [Smithellaceae bacterium]
MPNPVKRHSRTRRNMRRAHDAITAPGSNPCPHCTKPKLSHRVCPHCGFYKGREVIAMENVS